MPGPGSVQTRTVLLRGGADPHPGRPLLCAGQCDKQRRMLPDAGRCRQPQRLSGAEEEADPDAAARSVLRGGLCPGFERLLLPAAPSERRRQTLLGRAASLPGRNCAHPRQMRRGAAPARGVPSRDAQAGFWPLRPASGARLPEGEGPRPSPPLRASVPSGLRSGFCARPARLLPADPPAALSAGLFPQSFRRLRAFAGTGLHGTASELLSWRRIQAGLGPWPRAWLAGPRILAMSHPSGEAI